MGAATEKLPLAAPGRGTGRWRPRAGPLTQPGAASGGRGRGVREGRSGGGEDREGRGWGVVWVRCEDEDIGMWEMGDGWGRGAS